MRLTKAYRSLPRPSSAIEPNHPLYGLLWRTLSGELSMHGIMKSTLHPGPLIRSCTSITDLEFFVGNLDGQIGLKFITSCGIPFLIFSMTCSVFERKALDPSGFEPEAFRLQSGRSTRLIYGPYPGALLLDYYFGIQCEQYLGGDPAADSPTATLLRLNPSCEPRIRRSLMRKPHPKLTQLV